MAIVVTMTLVAIVSNISCEIRVVAVGLDNHTILVVTMLGGFEPGCAILFVNVAAFTQIGDRLVDFTIGIQAVLMEPHVEIHTEILHGFADFVEHHRHCTLAEFLTLFGIALTQRIAIVVNATVDARQVENRNTVGFCLIDDATCDLIDISALVTVDRGFLTVGCRDQRLGETVDLLAVIVEIVFAHHLGAVGLEHAGAAVDDVVERRRADVDRNASLVTQTHVEAAQQRTATGQQDAVVHKIRGKIGRRGVEGVLDGLGHLVERLVERATNLLALDAHGLGQARDHVTAVDLDVELVLERHGRTDLDLDVLGRPLADAHVVLLTDIGLYVFCKDVSGNVDTLAADDSSERDASDFGRTASDVDYHVAFRGFDVESGAERGGHRFVDHIHFAAAGVFGRIAHGPDLHVGRAGRDADHHFQRRTEQSSVALDHFDQTAQHDLRGVEIGDHAVFQRAYRLDILMGFAVHLARFFADRHRLAGMLVERHDRRLVHDDFPVADYDRVGRAEVDGQLLCQ